MRTSVQGKRKIDYGLWLRLTLSIALDFLGQCAIELVLLWDAIELEFESWCIEPVSCCGNIHGKTSVHLVIVEYGIVARDVSYLWQLTVTGWWREGDRGHQLKRGMKTRPFQLRNLVLGPCLLYPDSVRWQQCLVYERSPVEAGPSSSGGDSHSEDDGGCIRWWPCVSMNCLA